MPDGADGSDPAISTPTDAPMLAHWRGVYDHVFVALHPYLRGADPDRPRRRRDLPREAGFATARWRDVGERAGRPPFGDFAVASTLCANGMTVGARAPHMSPQPSELLLDRLRSVARDDALSFPLEDEIAPSFYGEIARILADIGAYAAEIWDEFRLEGLDAPLHRLAKGAFSVLPQNRMPAAISHKDRQVLLDCSFGAMDVNWTAIAFTEDVREVVRPDQRFEGFWANERTTPSWVNALGTYQPPANWPAGNRRQRLECSLIAADDRDSFPKGAA